jgi:alcohol dehydrogenase class IV
MKMFEFILPVKIVMGAGARHQTAAHCAGLGRKALIVCDPFVARQGWVAELQHGLREQGIASAVYDGVVPNPTTVSIDAGAEIAKREKCDFMIGFGGGSSMDTAKAVAVAAVHEGSIWPYAMGEKAITSATLPVVAITTTSGTGSQCTMFSVITNPETNQKPGMGSPFILPKAAIIDPELMLSLPPAMTRATAFDVFCHAVEAYTSSAASPLSDMYAEKAIVEMARNFGAVLQDGSNLEARAGMALADTCAGVAINHAVVSLGHVFAHIIGGHYHDIAHGDALYAVYREVLRFNASGLPEKHAWVARQLVPGCSDIVAAFDRFFGLAGFENRLKAKTPDADKIGQMAEEVFTYLNFAVELNPVKVDRPAARRILEASIA